MATIYRQPCLRCGVVFESAQPAKFHNATCRAAYARAREREELKELRTKLAELQVAGN